MKVIKLHRQEKDTIALAIEGNRHAQHLIYSTYAGKMLGVCLQYIRDIHDAEDLMITAFMKVIVHVDSFGHHRSFEGWILRIICGMFFLGRAGGGNTTAKKAFPGRRRAVRRARHVAPIAHAGSRTIQDENNFKHNPFPALAAFIYL